MRIINIEDCLELMCGLLIEEEFTPAIDIAEKDKKLLLSISQATFKGKALSDRQYEVVKKILTKGYQKDFLDRNVDLPSSVNNLRKSLRKIDRSEYIAIENYQDNLGNAGFQFHNDSGKCLVVRFPFNMKYSKLIGEIKKFILYPSEGYKSDNYKNILPFNETIVLDVDYIICNDILLNCFKIDEDFLIYRNPTDVADTVRTIQLFDRISDRSIDMWWATGFYFKKTPFMKMYFDLVKHIKDNWPYYRLIYQIPNNNYRNDFSFSIAIHILRGFQNSFWPSTMPGKMYMAWDSDMLEEVTDNKLSIVSDYKGKGYFMGVSIENCNVHVMNKFSLSRVIDKEFANE